MCGAGHFPKFAFPEGSFHSRIGRLVTFLSAGFRAPQTAPQTAPEAAPTPGAAPAAAPAATPTPGATEPKSEDR
jgi:hypothetical protein